MILSRCAAVPVGAHTGTIYPAIIILCPADGPTGGRGMVQVLAVNPYGPWPYDRCRCAVAGLKRSKFDWAVGRGQCDSLYCIV